MITQLPPEQVVLALEARPAFLRLAERVKMAAIVRGRPVAEPVEPGLVPSIKVLLFEMTGKQPLLRQAA